MLTWIRVSLVVILCCVNVSHSIAQDAIDRHLQGHWTQLSEELARGRATKWRVVRKVHIRSDGIVTFSNRHGLGKISTTREGCNGAKNLMFTWDDDDDKSKSNECCWDVELFAPVGTKAPYMKWKLKNKSQGISCPSEYHLTCYQHKPVPTSDWQCL
jgi:hypothetical protein